jgi:hypothetical protein
MVCQLDLIGDSMKRRKISYYLIGLVVLAIILLIGFMSRDSEPSALELYGTWETTFHEERIEMTLNRDGTYSETAMGVTQHGRFNVFCDIIDIVFNDIPDLRVTFWFELQDVDTLLITVPQLDMTFVYTRVK